MRLNLVSGSLMALLMIIPMTGSTCAPPSPTNQAPTVTASASPNPALINSSVALNGSASDPDGDTLTLKWTQTGGTPTVTINNDTTLAASFTAPATAATLSFQLKATDPGGLSGTAGVTVTVSTTVTTGSKTLYVTNLTGNSVTGYKLDSPNDANGNIAPISNLSGAQTLITAPRGIATDSAKNLQVGNDGNNSITSYTSVATPSGLNGNIAPLRNVQGAASAVNILRGLARQASTDLMYVSDAGAPAVPASIRVFTGASTSGFNGNLAPVRTITNAAITAPRGIYIDGADHLFIANETPPRVFVYDNASTRNGNIAPDRIIQTTGIGAARDVFVDSSDRLYVVDNANQKVFVYNNGSTRNGNNVPADSILTVTGATVLNSVITDTDGTGYISDRVGNKVFSYDNLANRNGAIVPDRTLSGAATLLNQPNNLLIGQ